MTTGPREISNLGIDASKQYALNQKELAPELLRDAQATRGRMEVSVISPARPFDIKFEIGYKSIWAHFDEPADLSAAAANLFIHLLVPSLGGADMLSQLLDRVAEPHLQKLLKQQLDDEEIYRMIQGRLRQFSKG